VRAAARLAGWAAVAGLAVVLCGCAALPAAGEFHGLAVSGGAAEGAGIAAVVDDRARFGEVFCALAARAGPAEGSIVSCDRWLWRGSDEQSAEPRLASTPGPLAAVLASGGRAPPQAPQLVIVTGAFSDCFGDEGLPFNDAVPDLVRRGYRIDTLQVSGRSSAAANAAQLAQALEPRLLTGGAPVVLLGYSKGMTDILELVASRPDLAVRVAAVISVAGAVMGSPLAEGARGWYDRLGAHALPARCAPGDGGVVDSLEPGLRRARLAAHPMPRGLPVYSVAALPQGDRIARALRPEWRHLARTDRRNDGQLRLGDALLPGSSLVALVNADHWGVALRIERALPNLAARHDRRPFPQETLLEALMVFVAERAAVAVPPAGE
jgi:hypothetical protein